MLVLLKALPVEAAVWQDDQHGWTQQNELTAALIEVVDFWGRQHAVIAGVKPQKLPPAVQVARPGAVVAKAEPVKDPRAIAAWFSRN